MTKKANHQVNIVRVTEIKPHTNADTLEIIPIGEYQVVSKKGQFKIGDLAVYIQPDSVVPQTEPFRFIWQPYLDDCANNPDLCKHIDKDGKSMLIQHSTATAGGPGDEVCLLCMLMNPFVVPDKKRRITVRKFRGEWSEGLLMPITDFANLYDAEIRDGKLHWLLNEGDDVSDELGITHYDPDSGKDEGEEGAAPKRKKRYPKTIRGWIGFILAKLRFRKAQANEFEANSLGIPVYDVDAVKNYPNALQEGEEVIITEKIHGSNARFIFVDGIMYAGSRNKWTAPGSANIFRRVLKTQPWIEEWCRAHEGYVLWGEIGPSQKGFEYGVEKGELFFFVFDIRHPDGHWLNESVPEEKQTIKDIIEHFVPYVYKGPYNSELAKKFASMPSLVPNAKNVREGIVIKTVPERHLRGVGRVQLKIVSNRFLEKDNK